MYVRCTGRELTSIVLRPLVVMASLRQALGARLTGLSLPEPFPLRGDSNPESMEDSEPLELSPLVMGSSIGERYVQGLCVWVIAMAAPRRETCERGRTARHVDVNYTHTS